MDRHCGLRMISKRTRTTTPAVQPIALAPPTLRLSSGRCAQVQAWSARGGLTGVCAVGLVKLAVGSGPDATRGVRATGDPETAEGGTGRADRALSVAVGGAMGDIPDREGGSGGGGSGTQGRGGRWPAPPRPLIICDPHGRSTVDPRTLYMTSHIGSPSWPPYALARHGRGRGSR